MKALYQAIYTLFAAGGNLNTAVGGRFEFVQATEGTTFPYVIYGPVYGHPEYYLASEKIEDVMVQFDLYSDESSAVEVLNMFEYLKSMFDDVSLTVSGYTQYMFERGLSHGPYKDPDSKIWHLAVEYTAVLQ